MRLCKGVGLWQKMGALSDYDEEETSGAVG